MLPHNLGLKWKQNIPVNQLKGKSHEILYFKFITYPMDNCHITKSKW